MLEGICLQLPIRFFGAGLIQLLVIHCTDIAAHHARAFVLQYLLPLTDPDPCPHS